MNNTSLLIKPVSGACNLHCNYCFYREEIEQRKTKNHSIMAYELLENLVTQAISISDSFVQLAFQGGEPMLAGIDYYKTLARIEKEHNHNGLAIEHSLQTNGTLIDEAWAHFFKETEFLVGISLDGPEHIHNKYRNGSFSSVMSGIEILQSAGVPFNILCVVTSQSYSAAKEIYEFFKSSGIYYMQFIPCIDNANFETCIKQEEYAQFMIELFDCWYSDFIKGNYRSIRAFDDYIRLMCGMSPGSCAASGICGQYLVIESDGRAYPCDFFATDEFELGVFGHQTLTELFDRLKKSPVAASNSITHECANCLFRQPCQGGCYHDIYSSKMQGKNRFCEAYKDFFIHAYPRLAQIAASTQISRQVK